MNKIQIITMGASDDNLVSIRGTIGEAALRFFADRLLGASADGFIVELHDTGETLRMFDGWGEMCMIEAEADGPVAVQASPEQTTMFWHFYTINKDDFVEALNKVEIQLPQIGELQQRTSQIVDMQHRYDVTINTYYCLVADEDIGWWYGKEGTVTRVARNQALTSWNHLKELYSEDATMAADAIAKDIHY